MSSSRKIMLAMTGGVVVMLLAFVALTGLAASFAWTAGGGYGSGPGICQSATPGMGSPTPGRAGTTPSPTGIAFACVPAGKVGAYTWYKAPGSTYPPGAPSFPQAVIAYGQQVCPGCSAWQSGTYQCVSFVRGAYSQVYPMTLTANAFDLWATYAGQPGWQEIPSAAAPAGQRGVPMPGDVMIFKDMSIGHAGIVMSVVLPTATADGAITFSNANSVSPYTTMPLLPDLAVDASSWPDYTVWGYIRPAGAVSVLATPTSGQSSP